MPESQQRVTIRPRRLFRILRHHTQTPAVIYYTTQASRDTGAQLWADRDGHTVVAERWDAEHPQDDLNLGWAADAATAPEQTTVTLHIDNHYECPCPP